jgi:hypothetical protein
MSGLTVGNLTSQTTVAKKSSQTSQDWVLTIYHSGGGSCKIEGGGSPRRQEVLQPLRRERFAKHAVGRCSRKDVVP